MGGATDDGGGRRPYGLNFLAVGLGFENCWGWSLGVSMLVGSRREGDDGVGRLIARHHRSVEIGEGASNRTLMGGWCWSR